MRYRPLDENGDMMPVRSSGQMLTETEAVAAAVNSRLNFFRGDWWEDGTIGFAVPKFLVDGLRGERDAQTLLNYIVAYILQSEGVTTVASSSYVLENRRFTANITVQTEYGQEIEGSVGMDELLSAIS